jgi:hypothetical protein
MYRGLKFIPKISTKLVPKSTSIEKGIASIQKQAFEKKPPLNYTRPSVPAKSGVSSCLPKSKNNTTTDNSNLNRPPITERKISNESNLGNNTMLPPVARNSNKPPLTKLKTTSSLQNIKSFSTQLAPAPSSGLLATELRALRRQEYENSKRQKEMLGNLMKRELEIQKTKQNQAEMKRLRENCIVRSHAIKSYKPSQA